MTTTEAFTLTGDWNASSWAPTTDLGSEVASEAAAYLAASSLDRGKIFQEHSYEVHDLLSSKHDLLMLNM